MPDKLPKGWAWAQFDELFQVSSDGGRRLPQSQYETSGKYPVIDQGEKDPGGFTDEELSYNGELPVILFGDHTRRFKLVERPFVVGAEGVKILRPAREVPVRFLWLAVNGLKIASRGYSRHFQFLKKARIPLAPLHEQERIVAKLDALLSRVAAGEAAARRALERLPPYRAAVLHAAVTGELTRDWRKTHPPEETSARLLKRLLKVRRSRWELRWLAGKLNLFVSDLKKSKLPRARISSLEQLLRQLCSFRDKVQTLSSWNGDWDKQWNEFKSIKNLFESTDKQGSGTSGGITRFRRGFGYLQSGQWKSEFYSEPERPELTELPTLPQNWVWASVDQMAAHEPRSITDGPFGSHLKSSHYTKSGPRVIRLQNIGDGVFVDEQAHISRKHYEFLKEHAIYAGDLVIRALGIPAPRACRIPENIGPAIVKADCIRFKVAEDFIASSYVLFALNSPATQHRTEKKIHGVGRPRLNLGEIKSIALPLPPQSEQKQIARAVERRLAAADRLAATLNRQLDRAQETRQSLLREAFAGNLVPQNPSDEPASVLLERIRAAREVEAEKPKAKRMPKTKATSTRRPLLDVLRKHKKPLTPEQLFRAAGFQPKEADSFYRELASLRKVLREKKPSGIEARAWPHRARVLLELKEN